MLQRTDASQMNATDVMLAEPETTQSQSMVDENVPDAPAVPSFDYARVVEALPGTPYMLTIAAQLAVMLDATMRSADWAAAVLLGSAESVVPTKQPRR